MDVCCVHPSQEEPLQECEKTEAENTNVPEIS